jgi:hypothetical protein
MKKVVPAWGWLVSTDKLPSQKCCPCLGTAPVARSCHETCLCNAFPIITPECHVRTCQGAYQ